MYITMIIKTIFLYFFIILAYRIMGKKEVGNLDITDLIVSILIAELAALSIEEVNRSIFMSVIPIVVLTLLEVSISFIMLKNQKFRNIIDGKPSVIIKNGKINIDEMYKQRYTLDDLLSQIREQGIKSISDVGCAILENNGKLSIFKEKIYPFPLIIDGTIDYETLKNIDKDYDWLLNKIGKNKIEDIFYAFYNGSDIYIIKK